MNLNKWFNDWKEIAKNTERRFDPPGSANGTFDKFMNEAVEMGAITLNPVPEPTIEVFAQPRPIDDGDAKVSLYVSLRMWGEVVMPQGSFKAAFGPRRLLVLEAAKWEAFGWYTLIQG